MLCGSISPVTSEHPNPNPNPNPNLEPSPKQERMRQSPMRHVAVLTMWLAGCSESASV